MYKKFLFKNKMKKWKKNTQKFTVTTKIEFAFPKYLCQDTLSQNLTRLFNWDINIRKIKL